MVAEILQRNANVRRVDMSSVSPVCWPLLKKAAAKTANLPLEKCSPSPTDNLAFHFDFLIYLPTDALSADKIFVIIFLEASDVRSSH